MSAVAMLSNVVANRNPRMMKLNDFPIIEMTSGTGIGLGAVLISLKLAVLGDCDTTRW